MSQRYYFFNRETSDVSADFPIIEPMDDPHDSICPISRYAPGSKGRRTEVSNLLSKLEMFVAGTDWQSRKVVGSVNSLARELAKSNLQVPDSTVVFADLVALFVEERRATVARHHALVEFLYERFRDANAIIGQEKMATLPNREFMLQAGRKGLLNSTRANRILHNRLLLNRPANPQLRRYLLFAWNVEAFGRGCYLELRFCRQCTSDSGRSFHL